MISRVTMENYLVKYGIVLGRRYTQKQKKKFLIAIGQEFTDLGYPIKYANDEKKGSNHSIDLFIGHLGDADTILCTHHDTGSHILWPNYRYYPLYGQKTLKNFRNVTLIPVIVSTVVMAVLIYLSMYMLPLTGNAKMIFLAVSVFLGLLGISYLSTGFGNKYNLNKNTASILSLLEVAKNLNEADRKRIAFVLLDHGTSDNMGAQMIKQALPTTMDKRLFVYLDCIGRGENIVIGHKANLAINAHRLEANYTGKKNISILECDAKRSIFTPTHFFAKAITITCGEYDEHHELFVDRINNSKDNFVDPANITDIAEMIVRTYSKQK